MRKRLIASNAPQKEVVNPRQIHHWSHRSIQGILTSAKDYASGIKVQRREGESFSIPATPIIDEETYERFCQIKGKRIYPYIDSQIELSDSRFALLSLQIQNATACLSVLASKMD
jgi:hypothetical protein